MVLLKKVMVVLVVMLVVVVMTVAMVLLVMVVLVVAMVLMVLAMVVVVVVVMVVMVQERLTNFLQARLLKPQRLVDISTQEERCRLEQTWKLMDERLHLCAFGTAEQLRTHVAAPEQFVERRRELVIIQSDQMPVYAMLRPDKQLYASHELRKAGSKSVLKPHEKMGD